MTTLDNDVVVGSSNEGNGWNRRRLLQALGGSAAVVGLATACSDDRPDTTARRAGGANAGVANNGVDVAAGSDNRAGSVVPVLTPVADLERADAAELHVSYAPNVPPAISRSDQRIVEFEIDVVETEMVIDATAGVRTMAWGFRVAGDEARTDVVPGPVMRARVGDLVRITVNNLASSTQAHNIDWHAIAGPGGGAEATTVAPGQSATINARLLYPGAFMYHCAFGDVPMHITHGMYGMFIVDPETPLPAVDHEWAIMQSEWYLTEPDAAGEAHFDPDNLRLEHPTYVVFNGQAGALTGDNALRMEVGQRGRIYFVNEGLNLDSKFHAIGSHWDVVYPEAATHAANRVIRGSQTTLVPAGGSTVTEVFGHVPLTIILVDHALVRAFYRGCVGEIVVSGEPNTIFAGSDDELAASSDPDPVAGVVTDENTVVIPDGAWNPANADNAYSPSPLTVPSGTTVTWVNSDTMQHTVTSGPSNGTTARPDGAFDSGLVDPGASWQYTFNETGTFDYHCTPHPWMVGQVIVNP